MCHANARVTLASTTWKQDHLAYWWYLLGRYHMGYIQRAGGWGRWPWKPLRYGSIQEHSLLQSSTSSSLRSKTSPTKAILIHVAFFVAILSRWDLFFLRAALWLMQEANLHPAVKVLMRPFVVKMSDYMKWLVVMKFSLLRSNCCGPHKCFFLSV